MKLSCIFKIRPDRWGLRGDIFFWDYLKNQAKSIEMLTPNEIEEWVLQEHLKLSGENMTCDSTSYVEEFAHGGMSSGCISGEWWIEEGIPLLKSRLQQALE